MITLNQPPQYLYYVGSVFTVEWHLDASGRMKARDYYEALSLEEQNRLDYMIKYFADSPIGTRLPKTLYNVEDTKSKIYAFKPRDNRFFNFMTIDKKIILLAAYRKHSQRMGKKDLNTLNVAVLAKQDYLDRTKAGTYYEKHA